MSRPLLLDHPVPHPHQLLHHPLPLLEGSSPDPAGSACALWVLVVVFLFLRSPVSVVGPHPLEAQLLALGEVRGGLLRLFLLLLRSLGRWRLDLADEGLLLLLWRRGDASVC